MGRIRIFPVSVILFVAVSLYLSSTSVAGICRFRGIGDLAGGDFFSKAYSVSADGRVVVGESHSALGEPFEAFRWENGVMTGIGDLPGDWFYSRAYAVSADGLVIVGVSISGSVIGGEAFRWENGVMTGLGALPPLFFNSKAYGVSADGSVIVGESESGSGTEAFRWTQAEGMVGLGSLGWRGSVAYGVSADGSVIVGASDSPRTVLKEAFRWTQATGMVSMGFLAPVPTFSYSEAWAVSADGRVIVGVTSSHSPLGGEGFRWENGVMTGLGPVLPYAVSADGSVIVGESSNYPVWYGAFIWDKEHGTRYLKDVLVNDCSLELTGWTLERATGVSADGLTVVGYGTNPVGLTEGWIAVIPEPATFLLLAFGGFALRSNVKHPV